MARPSKDKEKCLLIWSRVLEAAMQHHKRDNAYGMQKVIANDAGVGEAAVSKWKRGLAAPEATTSRHMANLYGVSAAWLEGHTSPQGFEEFGSPDELLERAAAITELVVMELLPEGTTQQFLQVMRRANELLLEGRSERDVKGTLFEEVVKKKRSDWREDHAEP